MALPVTEHFNIDEQNYNIEVSVDDHVSEFSDGAVESDAVAAAVTESLIADLVLKQPKKVSQYVLNVLALAAASGATTVEECIKSFTTNITEVPVNSGNAVYGLYTSGGAYADKADFPERSQKNLKNTNLAAFFMNSPTPESWLGKVLGPKLGKTWHQSSDAADKSYTFNAVYYANGIWVAGSEYTGLWWSTDGRNWSKGSGAASDTFLTVYYANGIWVAGSEYTGLWWSTDGKSWAQGSGAVSDAFVTVYYANGIWVAGSSYGLWWSTDGKNWTQNSDTASYIFNAVYHAHGIWVAGSSTGLWWSTDGKNWTQNSDTASYTFITVYYADRINGIWVAGSEYTGLWWSTDGKNWTKSDTTAIQFYIFKTVYYANGIWVAGSLSHGLWWSPNGIHWAQSSGATSANINAVYYANGIWVAGSSDTSANHAYGLWWSTDGKSWTRGLAYADFLTVRYANGIWVAGSSSHGIVHSGVADLGYA